MKKLIILAMVFLLLIVSIVSAQTRTKFEDMTEEDLPRGWPYYTIDELDMALLVELETALTLYGRTLNDFLLLQLVAGTFDSWSFICEDFESPLALIWGFSREADGPFTDANDATFWEMRMTTFEGGFLNHTTTGRVFLYFPEVRPQINAFEYMLVWAVWVDNWTEGSGKIVPLFKAIAYVHGGWYYSWDQYYK